MLFKQLIYGNGYLKFYKNAGQKVNLAGIS